MINPPGEISPRENAKKIPYKTLPNDYDGYCPAIWKQIHMNTRGKILPCCMWTDISPWQDPHPPALTQQGPEGAKELQVARNEVNHGLIPKQCLSCVTDESHGVKSYRQDLIELLGPIDRDKIKQKLVDADAIEYLDIRLGNTCNYMCNFCSTHNSHLIAKEWIADKGSYRPAEVTAQALPKAMVQKNLHKTVSDHPTKEEFINLLHRYRNLKFVELAGGEPFYMKKQTIKILETIPYKERVSLKMLTNCSLYDESILELTNHFHKLQLGLSVDATGRTLEIARWKSNWRLIQNNIRKFKRWSIGCKGSFNLTLIPAVSVYTIMDLPNLLEFGSDNEIWTNVSFVQDPASQKINMLKAPILAKVKEQIQTKVTQGKINKKLANLDTIYDKLEYNIRNNKIKKNTVKTFWWHQKYFERNRNYKLKNELPELYKLIKTV